MKKNEKNDHFVLVMVVCLISFVFLFLMFYVSIYRGSSAKLSEILDECPPFWHFYNFTNVEIESVEDARGLLIDAKLIDSSSVINLSINKQINVNNSIIYGFGSRTIFVGQEGGIYYDNLCQ